MKKLFLSISALIVVTSCTQNQRAKNFGGTANIQLPDNVKLVTVTWKQDDLWVLTKNMGSNDTAENYIFHEDSSFGIIEGDVLIKETKTISTPFTWNTNSFKIDNTK